MKISSDINCFYKLYSDKETVKILAEAGFDAIDYSFMNEMYYNGEIADGECKNYFTELKKYAEDNGIYFNQSHAPCPSSTNDDEETEHIFNNIVRTMKNASYLGAKIIVVHPLQHIEYAIPGAAEQTFELNMEFYNRLKPYCEEYEIRVALENLTDYRKTIVGNRFFHTACSTPDEFIRYIDTLNSECFVACLDIGHAIVVHQNPADFARKLGNKRLKTLHIHDSNGHMDSHTLPYLGGVGNWDEITAALKEIDYSGDINFEAGNFLKPLPKELYPDGAKMMAATGRYLANRIKKVITK